MGERPAADADRARDLPVRPRADSTDGSPQERTAWAERAGTRRRDEDRPPALDGVVGGVRSEVEHQSRHRSEAGSPAAVVHDDGSIHWRVDPWHSRTVRWLVLAQVATVDAGVVVVGAVVLLALAAATPYGAIAVLATLAVGYRYRGRAVVPLGRWRRGGALEFVAIDRLLLAGLVGAAGYLALYALAGSWTIVVLVGTFAASGLVGALVGDGVAEGRLGPGERGRKPDRDVPAGGDESVTVVRPPSPAVEFDGRSRSLERVTGLGRYRLGDLVLVRLAGPVELDERRWLAIPAAGLDVVWPALERGVGVADDGRASRESGADRGIGWRRLAGPGVALTVAGIVLVGLGVGVAAGSTASPGAIGLAGAGVLAAVAGRLVR